MGRKIVKFAPQFLQQLVTRGNTWSLPDRANKVDDGIPDGAKFIRGWYDGGTGPFGVFVMLFEHPSWEAVDEPYPEFIPTLEKVSTKR